MKKWKWLIVLLVLVLAGNANVALAADAKADSASQVGTTSLNYKPNPISPNKCEDPQGRFFRWTKMAVRPVGPPLHTYTDLKAFLAPSEDGRFDKPWMILVKREWKWKDQDLATMYQASLQGEGSNFRKVPVSACELLADMMYGVTQASGLIEPRLVGLQTLADWIDASTNQQYAWEWPINDTIVAVFFEGCSNPSYKVVIPEYVKAPEAPPEPAKPAVELKINGTKSVSVNEGTSVFLSWDAINCTKCRAEGAWSGEKPVKGSETVKIDKSLHEPYLLVCTGEGGEAKDAASATVILPPPPAPPQPAPVQLPPPAVNVTTPEFKMPEIKFPEIPVNITNQHPITNNHPITVNVPPIQVLPSQKVEVTIKHVYPWHQTLFNISGIFYHGAMGAWAIHNWNFAPGRDGKDGVNGTNGANGKDGVGQVGPQGPPGKDGKDGWCAVVQPDGSVIMIDCSKIGGSPPPRPLF
jgi:hypothetical protein